jgi:hypothetical protein
MEISQNLRDDFIKILGLDNLPPDLKTEILLGLEKIISQRIFLRVLDELSEKDKEEFDRFLAKKGNQSEEILKFLEKKIPHLNQIVKEEIESTMKESVEFAKGFSK